MSWNIYILLCDSKTYYIGLTSNLEKRVLSHKLKYNLGTKEYSNIQFVYSEKYSTRIKAEKREKQLKRWSAAKKKALIAGDKELLVKLSKARSLTKSE